MSDRECACARAEARTVARNTHTHADTHITRVHVCYGYGVARWRPTRPSVRQSMCAAWVIRAFSYRVDDDSCLLHFGVCGAEAGDDLCAMCQADVFFFQCCIVPKSKQRKRGAMCKGIFQSLPAKYSIFCVMLQLLNSIARTNTRNRHTCNAFSISIHMYACTKPALNLIWQIWQMIGVNGRHQ